MKVKINKLMPFTEENKKFKTASINIDQKTYYISPNPIQQKNYVGNLIQLHFICTLPDFSSDYQYLKSEVRVESTDLKQIVGKGSMIFKDIKRNQGRREFIFQFIPPYKGGYTLILQLAYKQRYFIQTTQPPEQKKDTLRANIICEDSFEVEQNIIYQQNPASISFPLFVQYIVVNKLKQTSLQLQMSFTSQFFDHKFLNNNKIIQIEGGQTYYIMLQLEQKKQKNKMDVLFGEKGLMIGTLWLFQAKNKFQKKLMLKPGYKHLLFKAETIDKKVVKKDIVEIKFINIYEIDYKLSSIRIGINEEQIPPGIKLLKISKDKINLNKNFEEVITLTMICLRSGLFQLKGIVLNLKDLNNPSEERILKYINELTLIVQNQKQQKKDMVMQKTVEIEIDSLI